MLLKGGWGWLNYDPSCACTITIHREKLMFVYTAQKKVLRLPSKQFESPLSVLPPRSLPASLFPLSQTCVSDPYNMDLGRSLTSAPAPKEPRAVFLPTFADDMM
jgi:hypothetical protein